MQYVRTSPPPFSFCVLRACAGGRHSGRCAPWRATGARREWAAPPRAATGRRSSRGVNERPQQLRPSERGGHVYLGWLPVVHLLRKEWADSVTGATELQPTAAAFATAQTGKKITNTNNKVRRAIAAGMCAHENERSVGRPPYKRTTA